LRPITALTRWFARYVGWLGLTAFVTLGGAVLLMVLKRWTIDAVFTSMLAWPALAIAMLLALPISLMPVGRFYFYSAIAGGLLYNAALLFA
ncbi:MAG: hypothetical protein ACFCUJ_02050, partial [Thiotrichales bacterium]